MSFFGLENKIWLECVPTLPTLLAMIVVITDLHYSLYYIVSGWLVFLFSEFLWRQRTVSKLVLRKRLLDKCNGRSP